MMDSVLSNGIQGGSDIFHLAGINDVAEIVSIHPQHIPRKIVARLFCIDGVRRHITTDIPRQIYQQHVIFSVMALLQAVLKELDEECISVLDHALTNMHAAYEAGHGYSDLRSVAMVPTIAYLSAITNI